jgi:hypothetical protein
VIFSHLLEHVILSDCKLNSSSPVRKDDDTVLEKNNFLNMTDFLMIIEIGEIKKIKEVAVSCYGTINNSYRKS